MIAWPTGAMEPAEFPSQFPPTHFQSPIQATWVLGALEGGRGDQERQVGGALGRSGRGAEGDCCTHTGSLLCSKANPLPSKPPPGYVGPWGHRREAGEIRRGRREGPCRTRGRLPHPLGHREPAEIPGRSPALQGPHSPPPHWSRRHRREAREIR